MLGQSFDVLVIGGGLRGCWTAYDAALRGLRTAIVERDDWAQALCPAPVPFTWRALVDIACGRLRSARVEIAERSRLASIGRHRLRSQRYLLPVQRDDRFGGTRAGLALWLHDRLSGRDRPHGPFSRRSRRSGLPGQGLDPRRMTRLFAFSDRDFDGARLALELIDGACENGTLAANHARATRLIVEGGRVVGAEIEDRTEARRGEVRAGIVAVCAGARCEDLLRGSGARERLGLRSTKVVHLVLPSMPGSDALLWLPADGAGATFAVPWQGRVVLGPLESDYSGAVEDAAVDRAEVKVLLSRVNRSFATARWVPSDVIGAHVAVSTRIGARSRRAWRLRRPLPGLLVPVGGAPYTARIEAAHLVDRALRALRRAHRPCVTAARPLPWSPGKRDRRWGRDVVRTGLGHGLDEETIESCRRRYGARIEQIFDRVGSSRELARRIVPDLPYCLAEVVHAAADEMALSLRDVLHGRVPMSLLCRLDEPTLHEVAGRVGAVLGWDAARRRREIDAVAGRTRGVRP